MNKPNDYDNTQAGGGFVQVIPGGHICTIKKVEETVSSTNKPMIKIFVDFNQGDTQPGYFTNLFKDDVRPDKKWPAAGTIYVLTEDNNGNCNRSFKTFTTCVEHSNQGFKINWDAPDWGAQFKNRVVGAVYGMVEEDYNGQIKMRCKHRWFVSADKALSAEVPAEKRLPNGYGNTSAPSGFVDVPDGTAEELPF